MRGIILAAGRGSRMGKETDNKPKCLTLLGGKTLLEYQLDALRNAGINEIAIVRGYNADKIDDKNVCYFENKRWNETNMVSSLFCAKNWLEKYECIISYSDIVYLSDTILKLKNNISEMAITYNTEWLELWKSRFEDPLVDAETFKIDTDYNLIEIGNKAKSIDEIQGQYMGLLKFTPKSWKFVEMFLDELERDKVDKMDMTTLLKNLISQDIKIKAIPTNGTWLEVDNIDDLKLYESWLNSSKINFYK